MRNETGFTLIELMVVVVIVGVMAAMAVASMNTGGANADRLAADVYGMLSRAKAQAALRNTPVGCVLWPNGGACFTAADGGVGPAAYALAGGLVAGGAADVASVVGQVRFDAAADVDAAPAHAPAGAGGGLGRLFYFLPDGLLVDETEAPVTIDYQITEAGRPAAFLAVESTGAVRHVLP